MKSDSLTFKEAKLNIAPALRRIKPYQNNSKYHRNDQASSMTVQTENSNTFFHFDDNFWTLKDINDYFSS